MNEVYEGQLLKIKSEFLDSPEEAKIIYRANHDSDGADRVSVTPTNSGLSLPPTTIERLAHLEEVRLELEIDAWYDSVSSAERFKDTFYRTPNDDVVVFAYLEDLLPSGKFNTDEWDTFLYVEKHEQVDALLSGGYVDDDDIEEAKIDGNLSDLVQDLMYDMLQDAGNSWSDITSIAYGNHEYINVKPQFDMSVVNGYSQGDSTLVITNGKQDQSNIDADYRYASNIIFDSPVQFEIKLNGTDYSGFDIGLEEFEYDWDRDAILNHIAKFVQSEAGLSIEEATQLVDAELPNEPTYT